MTVQHACPSMRLGITIAAVAIALGCGDHEEAPKVQPNIIVIVADTLRQDYLGAYGFEGDVSPLLDQFSERAILFENAISAAPWTKPSVASIFTSLRPEAHHMTGIEHVRSNLFETLNASVPTLASELRDAGYETVAFYSNAWLDPTSGLGRGFDQYEKVDALADAIAERGLQFMKTRNTDRPFFLYLHFMDVHGPYDCPKTEYQKLQNSPSLGADRALTDEERADLRYLENTKTAWLDNPDLRHTLRFWRTCYAAGVARFDARLAELFTELDSEPWIGNTVVLFSADHGEALLEHSGSTLGQHSFGQKGWEHGWSLRFHQTRVPLILRLPAGDQAGTRVKGVVSTMDIMPTLLELANGMQHPSQNARSLLPYVRGDEGDLRWVVSSGVKMKDGMISIQSPEYKLVIGSKGKEVTLFALQEDPNELNDIAEQRPNLVAKLKAIAESDLDRIERADAIPGAQKQVDPAIVEELRALGYVQDQDE